MCGIFKGKDEVTFIFLKKNCTTDKLLMDIIFIKNICIKKKCCIFAVIIIFFNETATNLY